MKIFTRLGLVAPAIATLFVLLAGMAFAQGPVEPAKVYEVTTGPGQVTTPTIELQSGQELAVTRIISGDSNIIALGQSNTSWNAYWDGAFQKGAEFNPVSGYTEAMGSWNASALNIYFGTEGPKAVVVSFSSETAMTYEVTVREMTTLLANAPTPEPSSIQAAGTWYTIELDGTEPATVPFRLRPDDRVLIQISQVTSPTTKIGVEFVSAQIFTVKEMEWFSTQGAVAAKESGYYWASSEPLGLGAVPWDFKVNAYPGQAIDLKLTWADGPDVPVTLEIGHFPAEPKTVPAGAAAAAITDTTKGDPGGLPNTGGGDPIFSEPSPFALLPYWPM